MAAMSGSITMVVPVYNRADLTAAFIQNYRRHIGDDADLIISNDGSTDGTADLLRAMKVRHVAYTQNQGFSRTCNHGAAPARSEYLLFVNNDVIFERNFIPDVRRAFETSGGVALVGAQLYSWDTGWNTFGGTLVPYLAGWFLGIPRSLFHLLGGFDTRYSPYDYEDMDLCYAAAQRNIPLVELPPIGVTHLSGQSFTMPAERRRITEINRAKFADKWGLPC